MLYELKERGLIKQTTGEDKIRDLLNKKITFYVGFDPTADSLHVGHLMQLITIKRLAKAGNTPIILLGGATAAIGDPTGKSDMRQMLSPTDISIFREKISNQISKIINCKHQVRNNLSNFDGTSYLSFIKDVAVHFSVNNMLRAECFKSRMEKGLTFLEMNYMLMQAFDFYQLKKNDNCVLQIGGDDQWSNILAGIDLIHKKEEGEVFGMTLPLLTTSTGEKMGKTQKGAVWLDETKTSVFDFFQFWRNLPDSDVLNCFKYLTFLSLKEINTSIDLDINQAKKQLAFEITKIVHGEDKASEAFKQSQKLFEENDTSEMEVIEVQDGIELLNLIIACGFEKSKGQARNLVDGNGVRINEKVITNFGISITSDEFGNELIIKKGKKTFKKVVLK